MDILGISVNWIVEEQRGFPVDSVAEQVYLVFTIAEQKKGGVPCEPSEPDPEAAVERDSDTHAVKDAYALRRVGAHCSAARYRALLHGHENGTARI